MLVHHKVSPPLPTILLGYLAVPQCPFQGRIQEFLKGGLYTIVVTFNANDVEGDTPLATI